MLRGVVETTVRNRTSHWNFLVNSACSRAVMVQPVGYQTNPRGRSRLGFRCHTVSVARRGIQVFFSEYPNYQLVVSMGRLDHDTCLFIRRVSHEYKFVWYNPNIGKQLSKIARNLMVLLKVNGFRSSRSYSDPAGNPDEKCSELVWMEMKAFLANGRGNMPVDEELLTYDATAKKYISPST